MVQLSSDRVRARRREILHAAANLFRERGFGATGMRDVAAACGMTAGNLYYYFPSKNDLLAFCQEEAVGTLLRWATHVESRSELSLEDRLFFLIAGHVICLNESYPGSLAHMQIEDLTPEWRARIVSARDEYEAVWRDLIRRGTEEGRFRAVDPRVTALGFLGAVNWTVKWYRVGGDRSAREIAAEFGETLVRGILARPEAWRPPERILPDVNLLSPDAPGAGGDDDSRERAKA
ncbi:MAG: TetR/AcrR family transcriptional regulator [Planctomycetes bacterium]|nr:TetR/AcrR family transcriptional regulator [Planctomycetota bacterium]